MLLKRSTKRSRGNSQKKYGQTRDESSKENSEKFCEKKGFHLYTTERKSRSAFAERNIRSLKNIIYKDLQEKWTETYIRDLP